MSAHDRAKHRARRRPSVRRAESESKRIARELRAEREQREKAQAQKAHAVIASTVARDFELIAFVATERKRAELAELEEAERLEAEELDRTGGRIVVCGDRGDQRRYDMPRRHGPISQEEEARFRREQWEQLGIDVERGLCVKLGER